MDAHGAARRGFLSGLGAGVILGLGVGAQWLAWRLRLPSILLLLLAGFVAGPIAGWIHPDALFGDLLEPLIAISVAIIMFEGGLGLRFSEIRAHGRTVARLVTVGVVVTSFVGAAAAVRFLGMPWDVAALLGVILSVSGPTVVLPLLRVVRPEKQVGAVLRWEGILIDPIGALLAVITYQVISQGGGADSLWQAALDLLLTLVVGGGFGFVAAQGLVEVERRHWIPDHLDAAVALGAVVTVFVAADNVLHEGGLVAVTVMGMAMANQRRAPIHHLIDFKENLSQILLGSLFIILAARIELADLVDLRVGVIAFVAVLVFVARPLAVLLSTARSRFSIQQRALLAWMAPRGIVAAAVSAFFGLRLEAAGRPEGALFVPVTFAVIVATVAIYGLTARPVAKALGVAGPPAQGILMIGSNRVTRALASVLKDDVQVLLADTNADAVQAARVEGHTVHHGDALAADLDDEVDLSGIGRMWAMTPNSGLNHLACVRWGRDLGRAKVYQVDITEEGPTPKDRELEGRTLFRAGLTYGRLRDRLRDGWTIRRTPITEQFRMQDHRDRHPDAEPLLALRDGKVDVFTRDHEPDILPGSVLIALVAPEASN